MGRATRKTASTGSVLFPGEAGRSLTTRSIGYANTAFTSRTLLPRVPRACVASISFPVALLDRDHIHHEQGRRCFERAFEHGWASRATITAASVSPGRAVQLLSMATSAPHHEYRRSEIAVHDETILSHSRIHGPRQITDVHLLGLAAHYGGRLVTLDRTIALSAIGTAGPSNLVVL